jgi:hypothetical protein
MNRNGTGDDHVKENKADTERKESPFICGNLKKKNNSIHV